MDSLFGTEDGSYWTIGTCIGRNYSITVHNGSVLVHNDSSVLVH